MIMLMISIANFGRLISLTQRLKVIKINQRKDISKRHYRFIASIGIRPVLGTV